MEIYTAYKAVLHVHTHAHMDTCTKPLDLEIQGTEQHVKGHQKNSISKIQPVGN